MPDAPDPITAPPALPWQPYDATAPGAPEDQTEPTTIYDAVGGSGRDGHPWVKIQDGGASNAQGLTTAGEWPGNGDSTDGGWKQC